MKELSIILNIIAIAANVAQDISNNPDVDVAASLAAALTDIAQSANKAHLEIVGKPINLDLLQPIELVP